MRACFTVDMEPDCPPFLSGWRGIDEGAPRLFALLRRWSIPATLFVTGALVRRDPGQVHAWADEGHELGCHGDAHVRFSTMAPAAALDDLRRATDTLARLGGPPRSFRAPNLDLPRALLPRLGELGYTLDSSEGRHKHPRARVRREAGLLRVPASTTSSLLRLPPALVAPLLRLLPSPLVLFVHPWELVDLRRERLRLDCRARTGPPALAALDGLFARLIAAGYRFGRMDELVTSC
jgi:peptidoglycan/xylan/chitin deacetylase (PgdA/CDA1 family)